jgi:hypothetical protein
MSTSEGRDIAHIPSRGRAFIDRAVCALTGHEPRRGANGWENFGTGIFCARCATMLDAEGQFYDFPAAYAASQRGLNLRAREAAAAENETGE